MIFPSSRRLNTCRLSGGNLLTAVDHEGCVSRKVYVAKLLERLAGGEPLQGGVEVAQPGMEGSVAAAELQELDSPCAGSPPAVR